MRGLRRPAGGSTDDEQVNPVTSPRHRATATRWTVAVLALATMLLGMAFAASAAYVLMFARALGAEVGPADLAPDAAEALVRVGPAVAVGWVVGVVAARLLSQRLTWPPWVTGLASGLVGCAACALALHPLGLV